LADLSLDDEVRAATFAYIQRLRTRFADRIPREALMAGVEIRGARVPIWNYQKGIHKPAVLGPNGAALSIQTSAESPYDDTRDEEGGRFGYKYRGTDPNHRDNVALRIAMAEQRPLLYLVAVDPGVYDAIMPVYVVSDSPATLEFTLVADQPSLALGSESAVMIAARREYQTRAVLQRLHQQHFRRIVLNAYRNQCSICRLKHVDLLDAAHILADRHPLGEPVVTNGLGLCKIHHSAFDAKIIGIDPDSVVHVRQDILTEVDGPMLRYGLQATDGIKLTLPHAIRWRPNRAFLAERFEEFRAA
jgi:putative restriction endonuclease